MEVRDIFALRKAGHIEEAYDLIRARYKVYHGHYTTLCMFWCASDMLQLHISKGEIDEAEKILRAMENMLPGMKDEDVIGNQMVKLRNMLKEAQKESGTNE